MAWEGFFHRIGSLGTDDASQANFKLFLSLIQAYKDLDSYSMQSSKWNTNAWVGKYIYYLDMAIVKYYIDWAKNEWVNQHMYKAKLMER